MLKKPLWIGFLTLGPIALGVGCGKQSFEVTSSNKQVLSPGTYSVPPKVDLLLVQDDTGSMISIQKSIASQMPGFLDGLSKKGWDFHFTTTPLTHSNSVSQIAASKFDSNWGSEWTPPYPGASKDLPGTIVSSLFKRPTEFTAFTTEAYIQSQQASGQEPGFTTISDVLKNRLKSTGFHRDDSLLVVLVVGNGNDTSDVNYCTRPADGVSVPCSDGSDASSFDKYKAEFLTNKKSASLFQFHSAVALKTDCLGSRAYIGDRYRRMSAATNGTTYDICTNPVNAVLDQLAAKLSDQKKNYLTRYLIIDHDASPDTIVVRKNIDGDTSNSKELVRNDENGWTYAGYLENVATISDPTPMSIASGYAIELHGTAKLSGADTASISFKPAGAQNSVTK